MKKKIIYLSMETKVREYQAKLLLALYALSRDYLVVFGSKYALNKRVSAMPSGIYVGTGVTKALGQDLLDAQKHGHRAASFDEEGLAYINKEIFMQTRISERKISKISTFFTWGPMHSELVFKKAPSVENVAQVGNMRLEILKQKYRAIYEAPVRELRERFGEFILVNTNLKVYNHLYTTAGGPEELYVKLRESGMIQSHDDEAFYRDRYAHQKEIFKSYQSLISTLAPKLGGKKIIIRPHTSENKDTWLALARDLQNVYVEREGGVIPWILASYAVIQKNCTTSIETVYLDKPVITYSVRFDARFDNEITNNIGRVCASEREVFETLENLESLVEQNKRDRDFLKRYASNMDPNENVALAILDALDGIEVPAFSDEIGLFKKNISFRQILAWRGKKVLEMLRRDTTERRLIYQKFPGLSRQEIIYDIAALAKTVGMSASSVSIEKIYDDLYLLK